MAQGSVFRGRWFKVYHFLGAWMFHYSFFIWVFFHEHSRFTVQKGKGEAISLIALYHFHPFQTLRHLDSFKDTQTFRQRHFLQRAPFSTYVAAGLELGTFDFQTQVDSHYATRIVW